MEDAAIEVRAVEVRVRVIRLAEVRFCGDAIAQHQIGQLHPAEERLAHVAIYTLQIADARCLAPIETDDLGVAQRRFQKRTAPEGNGAQKRLGEDAIYKLALLETALHHPAFFKRAFLECPAGNLRADELQARKSFARKREPRVQGEIHLRSIAILSSADRLVSAAPKP